MHTSILTKRLIWNVLYFAILFIALSSVIIGFITYHQELDDYRERIAGIQQIYLDVIRAALWVDDQENVEIALTGIVRTPGIQYVDIHLKDNAILCKAGNAVKDARFTHVFPIIHHYNGNDYNLGELHVIGNPDYLSQKIITAMLNVFLTQSVTILVVCLLVFFLFYRTVIGRLSKITDFASSLSSDSLQTPLLIKQQHGRGPDELDDLANIIDQMRKNLLLAFEHKNEIEEQLKQNHRDLETVVAQRTSSLVDANEKLQLEIDERIKIEAERNKLILDLQKAIAEVKKLSGMLPICSNCKQIRDDKGYWSQVESFIQKNSEAVFTHSICPECAKKLYPDLDIYAE